MADKQLLTGKVLRGPLTPDEREYYRHVASFNAITQGDRLTVQPCRDVLALDDALRAALERAEKGLAHCAHGHYWLPGGVVCPFCERDAALAKLKTAEDKLEFLASQAERLDKLVQGTAKLGGHHTYPEEVADIARSVRLAFKETTPLRGDSA